MAKNRPVQKVLVKMQFSYYSWPSPDSEERKDFVSNCYFFDFYQFTEFSLNQLVCKLKKKQFFLFIAGYTRKITVVCKKKKVTAVLKNIATVTNRFQSA